MLIDWFTVGAQAVNFLILVWLMKRYLYRPILNAIDEREKIIATELADAREKQAQAKVESDQYTQKLRDLEEQRSTLLRTAVDEAKNERSKLIDNVREESEELRRTWQDTLRDERGSLIEVITNRTRDEVFAIARKALADLATVSLEEQIVKVFIDRLQRLTDEERTGFVSVRIPMLDPLIIRSSIILDLTHRTAIENTIKKLFGEQTPLQFETMSSLVSGIELVTDGHKISWTISEYLKILQSNVNDHLESLHNTNSQMSKLKENK